MHGCKSRTLTLDCVSLEIFSMQEDYGPNKESGDSALHCDTEADMWKPDRFSQ